jgi:hypothetical protein
MTGPLWLHAALASLMIVIAGDCAIRRGLVQFGIARRAEPRLRWRWPEFEADCLHVVMGIAMAGMLLPQLRVLPAQVLEAVFGLGVAWFSWGASAARTSGPRRPGSGGSRGSRGAPLAHVIECAAMMFMLLPAVDDAVGRSHPISAAMAAMNGSGLVSVAPVVAVLLALCLVGYVVWTTDALARTRAGGGSVVVIAGGVLAPRLAAFSTIAMTLTMGYMLIQMA